MASTSGAFIDEDIPEELQPYRVMSKCAVGSLLLAVLSLLALVFPPMLVLPFVGLALAILGLRAARRYPEEVSGKPLAILGGLLCGLIFFGGSAMHAYTFATEVPDGYQRISFADLQPNPRVSDMPIPRGALDLQGKRVYVKGYLYPDGQQNNIRKFVLVPDMGTCCFGGQPKLTDMIEITLVDPLRTEFARRKRGFGGTLKVDMNLKPVSGVNGVYYQMTADYLR